MPSILFSTRKTQVRPNWRALSDFLTSILLPNIKKIEGRPFANIKKCSEKSLKAETRHKSVPGGRDFNITLNKDFSKIQKSYCTENLTLKL